MTIFDLKAFIIERILADDPDADVSDGSQKDQQIIQPLLRRIGVDPYTTEPRTFIRQRLLDEYPDQAIQDGDALSDLVVNMCAILMEPVVREGDRIRNQQSFADPSLLTIDEAAALGANFFSEVDRGQLARGLGRIYFSSPQDCALTPTNYFRSRGGLRFFLTENQSIRSDQMVLNLEGNLYYFDVSCQAEAAGDEYNIEPGELVSIAATLAAVRVTNKRRFKNGAPADDVVGFVGRVAQELGEKSLVTARGITAHVPRTFQEVSRIAVVGFGEPEMTRDILTGGSVGDVQAGGVEGMAIADGEGRAFTRRLNVADADTDFTALIGPIGPSTGYVVTLFNAFGPSNPPVVRDLAVQAVVSPTQLDFVDQVLFIDSTLVAWGLRKRELVISGIPGGILFPNTTNGTVSVPPGQVHIGGMTDVYVKSDTADSSDLVIDSLTDENPSLFGLQAEAINTDGQVVLKDLLLGTDYAVGDDTYLILAEAKEKQFTLQILEGPTGLPGSYRIVDVTQVDGASPILEVTPAPLVVTGDYRWRLLDIIDVDLSDPKEIKSEGSDLQTVQNSDVVDTASGVDFDALGVGDGDVLRILNGADADDYLVRTVLTPFYTRIQLDRKMRFSTSGLQYKVFRPNADGPILLPLLRITQIQLLDTGGQPTGSNIPYAKPIDIQTQAFSNPAKGIKWDVRDARLGLVSKVSLADGVDFTDIHTLTLTFELEGYANVVVGFSHPGAGTLSLADLVEEIAAAFPYPNAVAALSEYVDGTPIAFGVLPTPQGGRVTLVGGTARTALFDGSIGLATNTVTSTYVNQRVGWYYVHPTIDSVFDVLDVLEGYQIGHYGGLVAPEHPSDLLATEHEFYPEVNRLVHVGARSLGNARMYFLEPTSIELDENTRFSATIADGNVVEFRPDPTLAYQKIPALPSATPVKDGRWPVVGGYLESLLTDFVRYGVRPGDVLTLTYRPFTGTVALADPVPNLVATRLILALADGSNKEVIFVRDSSSIASTSVTRAGVAAQINQTVGQSICSIVADGADFHLEFDADIAITLRASGTANTLLGFSTVTDTDNGATSGGGAGFTIDAVDVHRVYFDGSPGLVELTRLHFTITRPGAQRITSTSMAKQVAETGLYYFDVELVSEGTGDLWNIPSGVQLEVREYVSDGYWLTTPDTSLTFSASEKPMLHVSRSMLEVGVNDDPSSATQLAGQRIQISYDLSNVTESVGAFLRGDETRVVCNSPLSRHLIPHYVRLDMTYQGALREQLLVSSLSTYIANLLPFVPFEASDLTALASKKGATSITMPLTLLAVVYDIDRSVKVTRSQNQLNIGRLAAFIPDVINVKRTG